MAGAAAGEQREPSNVDTPAGRRLTQPVLSLYLVLLQAADSRQRPSAVGQRHGNDYLVGARRIGNSNFDGIEMAANEGRVLVAERHVDRRAKPAHLLG